MVIFFRWVVICLLTINFIGQIVRGLRNDKTTESTIVAVLVGAMWGYVIYWLIHTINMF